MSQIPPLPSPDTGPLPAQPAGDRPDFGVDERQYAGIGEAAALLGLSRTSVQKLVDAGHLQAVKTQGGHRRVLRTSLLALRASMARRGSADAGALPEPAPPAVPRRQTLGVLLVDDDAAALAFMRGVLQRAVPGAVVEVARDGMEAVLLLERLRPDLLVTDLRMEPFDGYRLAWLVHGKPEFQGVQVLAVTAADPAEIASRGGLPPEVPVRHKPLSPEWLAGWVLGHAQARRRLGAAG
jgi:excisionase family DNA binding protein